MTTVTKMVPSPTGWREASLTPRGILYEKAREELRRCRAHLWRAGKPRSRDAFDHRSHAEMHAMCLRLALESLLRAAELREFAQRKPAWPQWCGCGDELGPIMRSPSDPAVCINCEAAYR